jgi:2-desacetyl-2-hydroxyethyl bacteriochlorophyllide A dehydrogenase
VKRLIFPGPHRVIFEEFQTPPVSELHVQVRSEYSLVSNGTERTVFQGRFASGTHWDRWVQYPFSPGYATVGNVVETGPGVSLIRVGQRVAIRAPHASHHVVGERACIPIPDQVDFEDAVWFALAKIGFLGTWVGELKLGTSVLIVGGGPVAQVLVRWLASSGAGLLGVLSRDPARLQKAKAGGATVTIVGHTSDCSPNTIERGLGERPQIVFDCTDSPDVLTWALGVVADYGRIVLVGDPGTPNERRLTSDVLLRSITVIGMHDRNTLRGWTGHTISKLFFERLSMGSFSVDGLCTHSFVPGDASNAYALLDSRQTGVLGIRFDWRDEKGVGTENALACEL